VLFDALRLVTFAAFGIGVGFMVVTNSIAFRVLRPAHRLGFLWWHVTAVSIASLCFGVVAVERVAGKVGDPSSWYGWVTLIGSVLFCVSQLLIFRVERSRLVEKQALRRVDP
jgi:hypothetical protein